MRRLRHILLVMIFMATAVLLVSRTGEVEQAQAGPALNRTEARPPVLSNYWSPTIQQWSRRIGLMAERYSLDADFIAAVVREESHGIPDLVSYAGAVGLMGVMPSGPDMEWRPSPEELLDPETNLNWGSAILADIIQKSGGDPFAALAAYSGGWDEAGSRVPREYAASVLNHYAQAVAERSGVPTEIANRWTLAIEVRGGHVPVESFMVLGDQPLSDLQTYAEHTFYNFVSENGRPYHVTGYVVPVALVVPVASESATLSSGNGIDAHLQARLGNAEIKIANSNPQVIIACLPSLSRLRGHVSTRWFAPSNCPAWHR